jgi:cbb3-type cytochrome oxidase subunit 3
MDRTSINFVIAAFALTWVVLGTYAVYAFAALRSARAQYAQAARGSLEASGRTV